MSYLFDHSLRSRSSDHEDTVSRYEMLRTMVEFLAALAFVIGSVMFFYDSLKNAAIWMFVIGSLLFGARPAVRLAMEVRLLALPRKSKSDGSRETA